MITWFYLCMCSWETYISFFDRIDTFSSPITANKHTHIYTQSDEHTICACYRKRDEFLNSILIHQHKVHIDLNQSKFGWWIKLKRSFAPLCTLLHFQKFRTNQMQFTHIHKNRHIPHHNTSHHICNCTDSVNNYEGKFNAKARIWKCTLKLTVFLVITVVAAAAACTRFCVFIGVWVCA